MQLWNLNEKCTRKLLFEISKNVWYMKTFVTHCIQEFFKIKVLIILHTIPPQSFYYVFKICNSRDCKKKLKQFLSQCNTCKKATDSISKELENEKD